MTTTLQFPSPWPSLPQAQPVPAEADSGRRARVIRLRHSDGSVFQWRVWHEPRVFLVHPDGPLSKSRYGKGWVFADHEGYERFTDGTWYDMLPRLRLVAENYGCVIETDLTERPRRSAA